MIKLTLKDGCVVDFRNECEDLNTENMVQALFDGETSAREGVDDAENHQDYIVLNDEIEFPESYVEVVKAAWTDDAPEHLQGYVLDRMNAEGVSWVFSMAEGNNTIEKPYEVVSGHWHAFHEAVQEQINLEGLGFVFGNGFCLSTTLDFVVREIVRGYLREIDLY